MKEDFQEATDIWVGSELLANFCFLLEGDWIRSRLWNFYGHRFAISAVYRLFYQRKTPLPTCIFYFKIRQHSEINENTNQCLGDERIQNIVQTSKKYKKYTSKIRLNLNSFVWVSFDLV